ncbi:hypothetical protein B0H63DRAFT_476605 [Podospora didyma]|uniref:Secreted protein n=1 Tax=Podospora didyma TaxID=330526 RepID=A0AAE0NHT1_9PEZI|nr:hypothetical protein B0H63DRAFT_476605 [Podospora didyma]
MTSLFICLLLLCIILSSWGALARFHAPLRTTNARHVGSTAAERVYQAIEANCSSDTFRCQPVLSTTVSLQRHERVIIG